LLGERINWSIIDRSYKNLNNNYTNHVVGQIPALLSFIYFSSGNLVSDGVEAVINFIQNPYEFVLLDLRMPRLNGSEALRIIKSLKPNIPIISFSGHAAR